MLPSLPPFPARPPPLSYWKAILEDERFGGVLRARTNGDLKDKW